MINVDNKGPLNIGVQILFCYKDRTFCSSDCANKTCYRYFGDKQREEATAWWGGEDFPIAYSDYSSDCPDYQQPMSNPGNKDYEV